MEIIKMSKLANRVTAIAAAFVLTIAAQSANAFDKDHSTITFSKSQGP